MKRATKTKVSHVGAPAIFKLENECKHINDAFGSFGCYLVGSAIERPDWRDVDIRFIMEDEEFDKLFPGVGNHWEHDPKWLLLTISISEHLSKVSGLPVDFQFQRQTHANERYKGIRYPIGLRIVRG